MTLNTKPQVRPARPFFSSGPCAKPPGWSTTKLPIEACGRSHRSKIGKERLRLAIDLMRQVLRIPDTHRIGIVPGSNTGAVEMALWSLLGERSVTLLAWESFGQTWVGDVLNQLKLSPVVHRADYGLLPDLAAVDWANDVIFTWNGTTSGVRVPSGDWIPLDRAGLSICDATSAAFAHDLPWNKLDVTTFSWQKMLGGEAAHGVIILGPRAIKRLETYTPNWPLPKIFRMTKPIKQDEQQDEQNATTTSKTKNKLIEGIFIGETINTPSMLCVEDVIFSLEWVRDLGGLDASMKRCAANAAALDAIVAERDWLHHLARDAATRSLTSVCLSVKGADTKRIKAIATALEAEQAAFDIAGYRDAPAGLRIWCGATVDTADVEALGPWLDWAYGATAS